MKTKLKIFRIAVCALLVCGLFLFSGCPMPWYIPKKYGDKKLSEIYAYIKDELLTSLPNFIAGIDYTDPDSGAERHANIWSCDGKVIINFDIYSDYDAAVYYDGVYKSWDKASQTETVKETELGEWQFLFDAVKEYAEYLKTVVGSDYDDGYCHECFPWGFGMAQIYYESDGVSTTAMWQVEKSKKKPLVSYAEFISNQGKNDCGSIEVYAEPFDIDVRIENILNNYESQKRPKNDSTE